MGWMFVNISMPFFSFILIHYIEDFRALGPTFFFALWPADSHVRFLPQEVTKKDLENRKEGKPIIIPAMVSRSMGFSRWQNVVLLVASGESLEDHHFWCYRLLGFLVEVPQNVCIFFP